ncbi:endonuclease/exonuclease/phosphatase family protein [Swingsia samuiensis]|uniref:Endonuclease/exonuclease/phosphatase family protein n=2 Tax=Swingsia samuiensis TaxID=1293412 RepID=A0A4Y6UMC0_9PROT|nr:endonuclease/exonuclease/phosphatase family protein [Swingsia samuiensis]
MLFPLVIGLTYCESSSAFAHDIKLSTWNLDWLSLRNPDDADLPSDIPHRSPNDFEHLNHYTQHLNADIIALQEVDGPEAAKKVFNPKDYQLVFTHDEVVQRTGIAVKHNLIVTQNDDVKSLDVSSPTAKHHLRSGLDVSISDGKSTLRLLVVHLKTGCWEQPLQQKHHSCPQLYQQFHILEDWVAERQDEGSAFVVLGDFNRRLTLYDPIMIHLQTIAPLLLTTAGKASPCWGGEYFIDHILLGNAASSWLVPNSLRVMTYKESASAQGLSDHCPVSITLHIP